MEPWRAVDAQIGGMEPRRVCRTVVAVSYHFNEEQDPVPH
jgi:hypothetical protein